MRLGRRKNNKFLEIKIYKYLYVSFCEVSGREKNNAGDAEIPIKQAKAVIFQVAKKKRV